MWTPICLHKYRAPSAWRTGMRDKREPHQKTTHFEKSEIRNHHRHFLQAPFSNQGKYGAPSDPLLVTILETKRKRHFLTISDTWTGLDWTGTAVDLRPERHHRPRYTHHHHTPYIDFYTLRQTHNCVVRHGNHQWQPCCAYTGCLILPPLHLQHVPGRLPQ